MAASLSIRLVKSIRTVSDHPAGRPLVFPADVPNEGCIQSYAHRA